MLLSSYQLYSSFTYFWLMLTVPIFDPMKKLKNHWFVGVFRGYKMGTLARNGLNVWMRDDYLTYLFPMDPFSAPWKH